MQQRHVLVLTHRSNIGTLQSPVRNSGALFVPSARWLPSVAHSCSAPGCAFGSFMVLFFFLLFSFPGGRCPVPLLLQLSLKSAKIVSSFAKIVFGNLRKKHYLCRRNKGIVPESLIIFCTMCKHAYFQSPSSKSDFVALVEELNRQGIGSDRWGFFTAVCRTTLAYFVPVQVDFDISGGKYIYCVFDQEDDALAIASKVSCSSMVLPDAEGPDFWLIIRVD